MNSPDNKKVKKIAKTENDVIEGKVFAILSYLFIFCIVPLVIKKDNKFVLHHGKQGLVIFVGEVAVFIIHIILPFVLKLGIFIFGVLSLIGIISVLQGRFLKLPVIYDIAETITL